MQVRYIGWDLFWVLFFFLVVVAVVMQQEIDGITKAEILKDLIHKMGGRMLLYKKQLKQLSRLSSFY
jgi:hypothetical protein